MKKAGWALVTLASSLIIAYLMLFANYSVYYGRFVPVNFSQFSLLSGLSLLSGSACILTAMIVFLLGADIRSINNNQRLSGRKLLALSGTLIILMGIVFSAISIITFPIFSGLEKTGYFPDRIFRMFLIFLLPSMFIAAIASILGFFLNGFWLRSAKTSP